jgi:hypothetical protein
MIIGKRINSLLPDSINSPVSLFYFAKRDVNKCISKLSPSLYKVEKLDERKEFAHWANLERSQTAEVAKRG